MRLQKTKLTTGLVLAVLILSIILPFIQSSIVSAQLGSSEIEASIQLTRDDVNLSQHKMTPSELQEYKTAVGINQEKQTYQAKGEFGTGLTAPTEEGWSEIAQKAYLVENIDYQAALPESVDLSTSSYFPPIGDQGQQGSCASFATGYYCKTYQEAKEHNWDLSGAAWIGGSDNCNISDPYKGKVMSPAFVYNTINGGEDIGSDFETPINLICNVGVCSWQNMPYYWQDCTRWPTEAAWSEAPMYRSNDTYSYQYLYANTTEGLVNLKNWLAAGNPAIIAVDAYDNLWNYTTHSKALGSQDLMTNDTYIVGELDHAATIVGYDNLFAYNEGGEVHHGAIKIANSWGIDSTWENIPDGYYWISYAALMKLSTPDNPVMLFKNLDNYQPELTATFNVSHETAGDCVVAFGLGNWDAPLAFKNFSAYITGGDRLFCANNIVLDLSEFKANLISNYNQQFFIQVYDNGAGTQGTGAVGTINYFAIANTASTQTPKTTVNDESVYAMLTHSFAPVSLSVSPLSGPAGAELTLTGVGMAGNTVDISYYNPVTMHWVPVTDNYAVSTNFTYALSAPDLQQCGPTGDNPQSSDGVVFRVQDGGSQYDATYTEVRRGFTQVNNKTADGVFGNYTDLSTQVFAQNGQAMHVAGLGFKPGSANIFWDAQNVGATTVDFRGLFNTSVIVPATTAGKHVLTVSDGVSNVSATVTRLPIVANNGTTAWQIGDFTVNLTPDYEVTETYYKINSGQIQTVSEKGQPLITIEGDNNTLEYWSTWNIYNTGNMELSHTFVSGLKLDKTAPTASVTINVGKASTTTNGVALLVFAHDSGSGIKQIRFSNDNQWSQTAWEPYQTSKFWYLDDGLGTRTVYVQVIDNAGLITTASNTINVVEPSAATSTPKSTATPTPNPTSVPTVPEFAAAPVIVLSLLTALLLTATRIKGKSNLNPRP